MYLSSKASRIRQREAQQARDDRAQIIKARSLGQITRRDLYKWGIFTAAGALTLKNGLSPFARSAFAAVPTGIDNMHLSSRNLTGFQCLGRWTKKPESGTEASPAGTLLRR